MMSILRIDSPWIWGLHPTQFVLFHNWYKNTKPNLLANNTLKYKRIDPAERTLKRAEWNRPVLWPVLSVAVLLIAGLLPAMSIIKRRRRAAGLA